MPAAPASCSRRVCLQVEAALRSAGLRVESRAQDLTLWNFVDVHCHLHKLTMQQLLGSDSAEVSTASMLSGPGSDVLEQRERLEEQLQDDADRL